MRISDWSSDVCSSDLLDPATAAGDRMRLPIEFFGAAAPTGNEYRAPQNQCGLGIVGIEARPCPSSEPAAQHLPTICVGGFNDAVLKSPAQDRLAIAPQGSTPLLDRGAVRHESMIIPRAATARRKRDRQRAADDRVRALQHA